MFRYARVSACVTAIVMAVAICSAFAADVLTYQGRLTDASNNPVPDGLNALRFRIYDALTGGNLLWQEYNPSVQTTSGMFSVRLGELAALDLGSLGNGTLYLEIVVGVSPSPLMPRTPLTSSPRSAVAGKVMGDLETSPGVLTIKRSDGDSTISIRSFDGGISMRMFDPQPEPPGKAVIELSSTPVSGSSFRMFDPQPEPPGVSFEMLSGTSMGNAQSGMEGGSAITGPSFRMFDPQPEPPGKRFELLGNINSAPSMSFFDQAGQVMGVEPSPFGGMKMVMFDPQLAAPGKRFELAANSGSGPSMSFFNQAGQVMGVEPTPWNTGFSIKMFDPQPEPPGKMLEFGTSFATGAGEAMAPTGAGDTAWFRTYAPDIISPSGPLERIILYSTDTTAELRMGAGAPFGSSSQFITAKSNAQESRVELKGPSGGAASPSIVLTSYPMNARIGIGTSSPTQALHVVGNICYTGTIGACSDGKFKKDVKPVDHALDMVSELEGVRYQWKADEYPEQQFAEGTQIGFVAQEVKKVLPEVVMEQPDGSLAIDYGRLTPVLLEAIKELKKQNEQLVKRVTALEKK